MLTSDACEEREEKGEREEESGERVDEEEGERGTGAVDPDMSLLHLSSSNKSASFMFGFLTEETWVRRGEEETVRTGEAFLVVHTREWLGEW